MRRTGAWLAVRALERLGVRHTFGIPGVHNTELYDELSDSATITPVLVTHEGGAAFMADAVSRVSDSIGVLAIVPAAGLTHAASGIGEAYLAGIPMLVLAAGVRTDLAFRYQLHQMDQLALAAPITKAAMRVESHRDVMPALYRAWSTAVSGEPGPVLVEIPVNILLFSGEVEALPDPPPRPAAPSPAAHDIERAAELLASARAPGIFLGWGAREALAESIALAERLNAPVATTLQGLSSFPASHPLHCGFGFGPAAVPAARNAFARCDALLAVGTRFAEIATGSFGVTVPANLVHIDINPKVFGANYPAAVAIESDAKLALAALVAGLEPRPRVQRAGGGPAERIAQDKRRYRDEWLAHAAAGRVNPARFFDSLRRMLPESALVAVDDGNHTYLTAELFPVLAPKSLIVPTDFNCMGYAVPAAIGAALVSPGREVAAIVGDGAFMMSCMEIVTAAMHRLGIAFFVFRDGELSQIAQAQRVTYARSPCSTLGALVIEGVATATGAAFVRIADDAGIDAGIAQARALVAQGRPVIVEVNVDYSKRTAFTQGAVQTNFRRLPFAQKLRMAARVLGRRLKG